MEYKKELAKVTEKCSNWDSESSAIREAFDSGIDYQKKMFALSEDLEVGK